MQGRKSTPAVPVPTRRDRTAGWAWWQHALGAFAVSRVVSTGLWLIVIALARPGSRIGQHASLPSAMAAWDGQWYQLVAASGYPRRLPVGYGGLVDSNTWAFLPAYPFLVKAFTFGHPAAWPMVAELVSTAFGFGAAVLLALLLKPHVGDEGAVRAVWLFALSPVAFILQAAYAESMALFLSFAALCLLDRHRYLAAIVPTLLLAFTRPGVQAVALTVGVHLLARLVGARRGGDRVPPNQVVGAGALLLVAAVSGFVWGWIAAAVTGVPDAYLRTELAWRSEWMGPRPFEPFVAWPFSADFWFGAAGPVVLAAVLGTAAALLMSRSLRRIGLTSWAWTLSWSLYLLAVFFPQSSTFRLLLPLAPTGGALASIRSRGVIAVVLTASVALQAVWLYYSFGGWQQFWGVP